MEATASIVALVAFAFSSTKAIYETVSGVRDGPQVVVRAAQSLQNALNLLETIKNEDQQYLPEHFRKTLQDYGTHLTLFQEKINKLGNQRTDSSIRRSWKRFKTVLQTKDLHSLHLTAHEFTTVILSYRQTNQLYDF